MSHRFSFVPAFIACALFACSPSSAAPRTSPAPSHGPRARVTTLTLGIEAADLRAQSEALRTIVERERGYVRNATITDELATFDLRVPSDRIGTFRRAARALGDVTTETETMEDVGDRSVDLEARLRAAQREEDQVLALLAADSTAADAASALEQRASAARERIEILEAERAALAERVDYATVQISIFPRTVPFWREPTASIGAAASFGFDVFSAIAVSGLALIAAVGPALLSIALAIAAVLALARHARRRARA